MPIGFWFWLIYVLCVLFTAWPWYTTRPHWWEAGGWFWLWVLIAILGWHDFGPPWAALVH
jgi:hypothetical protein